MYHSLLACIVALLDDQEEPCGTGFVISNSGLILTCSHVIQCQTSQMRGEARPEKVTIEFLTSGEKREALIERWFPSQAEDVAVLRVEGALPKRVRSLPLSSAAMTEGHTMRTYGFPAIDSIAGFWAHGEISGLGPKQKEKETKPDMLQLHSGHITQGFSGAPVWDDVQFAIIGMISEIVAPDRYGRLTTSALAIPMDTLQHLCDGIHVRRPLYRGLAPFSESEADLFFGYHHITDKLLNTLQLPSHLHQVPQFLAVLGARGSGKTSVVQAGLIPHLRRGGVQDSEQWGIITTTLSHAPLEQLEAQGLIGASTNLTESVHAWLRDHAEYRRLVLIIDQFEEVLVRCQKDVQQTFVQQVDELLHETIATVILVVQDDFYSLLARHEALIPWVERSLVHVLPSLTKETLAAMVQRPAERMGVTIEKGLVETIVDETMSFIASQKKADGQEEKSILALFEWYLQRLWKESDGHTLTHAAYKRLEGLEGGLTHWADGLFDACDERQKVLAKRLFTSLVQVGDSSQGLPDRRRYVPLSSLCRDEYEYDEAYRWVQTGLLTTSYDAQTGQEMITIAQEVLLQDWARLIHWLSDDRRFLAWHQASQERTGAWLRSAPADVNRRDEQQLLQGAELSEAEIWLNKRPADLLSDEGLFIRVSRERRDQEQRQHQQEETIAHQRHLHLARQLAAQAQAIREQHATQLPLSVLLAIEALREAPCPEAYRALSQGLLLLPHLATTLSHRDTVHSVAFSADGNMVVSASHDAVIISPIASARQTQPLDSQTEQLPSMGTRQGSSAESGSKRNQQTHLLFPGVVNALAFSPDGYSFATVESGRDAKIWDVCRGTCVLTLNHRVCTIALSDENTDLMATGDEAATVVLWKRSTGQQVLHFAHPRKVRAITFSPDGGYLVTVSEDSAVRIWDCAHGRQMESLRHEGVVQAVACSPDGTYLATTCDDREVWLWRWDPSRIGKRKQRKPFAVIHHASQVRAVTFSLDSRFLASASSDGSVNVSYTIGGTAYASFQHDASVNTVVFSPDGNYLVSASEDGTARMWNLWSKQAALYFIHQAPVTTAAFHPQGHYLVTGSKDRTARVWDTTSGTQLARLWHTQSVDALAFCPIRTSRQTLVTGSEDRTAHVVEVDGGSCHLVTTLTHRTGIRAITTSSDGRFLATAGHGPNASIWEMPWGHHVASLAHHGRVHAVSFSSDGQYVASGSEDGMVKIWERATGTLCTYVAFHTPVHTVVFSPHGYTLATGGRDGVVRIWVYDQGKMSQLSSIQHSGPVNALVFSPDGEYLGTASEDGTTYIWRWAADSQHILTLHHDGPVRTVAFRPDGSCLATASLDGTVQLCAVATGDVLARLRHEDEVWSVAFNPDGEHIATACGDGSAGLWKVFEEEPMTRLPHAESVSAVTFSADGRYLATASHDGTASIWLWRPEDLAQIASKRLTRNLTREEWQSYLGNRPYHKACPDLDWRGAHEG